ncbi:MAG: lytic transglycosylase domain-containing protein [Verrucomicrobia bacterium]|nr:lytic transglycosylase domain-containing protein [Verrucomicrobiota bacterium]MCH8510535.1 lytic transglycosylase domain-containing protein [Kiritimatiellia bacterium]
MSFHPPRFDDEQTRPRLNGWTLGICLFVALWVVWTLAHPLWLVPTDDQRAKSDARMLALEDVPPPVVDLGRITDLLVEAIVQIESAGNPTLVGGVGERGLMQIREGTWREVTRRHYGQAIPFDRAFEPELNRRVGRLYLGDLQAFLYRHRDEWSADMRSLLFAAYNAGPRRVKNGGFTLSTLPAQTQSYVRRASALHDWYLEKEETRILHELLDRAAPEPVNAPVNAP